MKTIEINNPDQYDAIMLLAGFLYKLELKQAKQLESANECAFGDEWAQCENCDHVMSDCRCHEQQWGHGNEYNDESMFD